MSTMDVQHELRFEEELFAIDLELHQAALEVSIAQQHFDLAEPAYIDAAIHELNLAQDRLNSVHVRNQGKDTPEVTVSPLPWVRANAQRLRG